MVVDFCIFELKIDCLVKSMTYKRIGQDIKENQSIDFKELTGSSLTNCRGDKRIKWPTP
jgi:hypothetical protein